jgi:hypothetical protein
MRHTSVVTGATTEGTTGEGDNESEGHHEEEEECDPEPCITPQEVQLYALSGLLHISMEPQVCGWDDSSVSQTQ